MYDSKMHNYKKKVINLQKNTKVVCSLDPQLKMKDVERFVKLHLG